MSEVSVNFRNCEFEPADKSYGNDNLLRMSGDAVIDGQAVKLTYTEERNKEPSWSIESSAEPGTSGYFRVEHESGSPSYSGTNIEPNRHLAEAMEKEFDSLRDSAWDFAHSDHDAIKARVEFELANERSDMMEKMADKAIDTPEPDRETTR